MSRMEAQATKSEIETALRELSDLRGGPEAADDFVFLSKCMKVAKAMAKDTFGPTGAQPQTVMAVLDCMVRLASRAQKPETKRDAKLDAGEASFD